MDFLGLVVCFRPLPNLLFTSALTFSYSTLLIPSDLRLFSLPFPCLPSITSCAICEILFVLLDVLVFVLVVDLICLLATFLPPPVTIPKKSFQLIPCLLALICAGQFFPDQWLCCFTLLIEILYLSIK